MGTFNDPWSCSFQLLPTGTIPENYLKITRWLCVPIDAGDTANRRSSVLSYFVSVEPAKDLIGGLEHVYFSIYWE